ncbi:Uncharacterised protein [Klebsiella pneumoniae]|nr:Uncharacterised protein [Klebsiella pneumoniae]
MPGHTENARLNAELRLSRKQSLNARLFPFSRYAADNIGGGFLFGFALRHAHDNGHRFCLVGNRIQRAGQRAGIARLAAGGQYISQQYRLIEGKHGRIGIIAGADHAHDGGTHRGNGSGAVVDFNNAHPVVVILSHKAVSPVTGGLLMFWMMGPQRTLPAMCHGWHNKRPRCQAGVTGVAGNFL